MAHRIQNLLKTSNNLNLIGIRSLTSSSKFDDVQTSKMHLAVNRDYPKAETLPLPFNIDPNEATRFSPLRNRDISSSEISVHTTKIDVTLDQQHQNHKVVQDPVIVDARLNSYDRQSPVNLSSVMQTSCPDPYSPSINVDPMRSSYLSYPGGSWGQQTKYLSHELNSSHYTTLRQEMRSNWSSYKGIDNMIMFVNRSGTNFSNFSCLLNHTFTTNRSQKRFITLNSINLNEIQNKGEIKPPTKETGQAKLKKAIKEYGSVVIIFHVGISLISLGLFYTLVSSGLDVMALLEKLNLADKLPSIAENASTFLIAYAVHKVFAPARISITLFSTPFIVRFLRNKNILKPK